MDQKIIFFIKGILLTEALTHAVRSWGILSPLRDSLMRRSEFISRLISCFECTSIWIATAVFLFLYFLDLWPFTFIIIAARLATIFNIGVNLVDALRASTINKI